VICRAPAGNLLGILGVDSGIPSRVAPEPMSSWRRLSGSPPQCAVGLAIRSTPVNHFGDRMLHLDAVFHAP